MHPNEVADINHDRESLPGDAREQDSESDKNSVQRNEDDEDKPENSSEDEDKNKSDSEKEESDNDDDEAEKKSKRSSTSASRKSSSSSQEDKVKRKDEKADENKPPSDDIAAEVVDNLTYEEKVRKAFVGDLDFSYPEKVKIVRIFTSSTFTGTHLQPFSTLIKPMFIFQKFRNTGEKSIVHTRHAHIHFTEVMVADRNLSTRHARYLLSKSEAKFCKE